MLNKNNHSYNQPTLKLAEEWSNTINTSIKQNATVHRQVTINNDNSKSYGEWSQDYWEEYNAPNSSISSPDPAKYLSKS